MVIPYRNYFKKLHVYGARKHMYHFYTHTKFTVEYKLYLFIAGLRCLVEAMKSVFILLLLVHKSHSYRSPNIDPSYYCDSVLNREHFTKSTDQKEDACRFRRYSQRDVAQCLDQMAAHRSDAASNSNHINNHFIFIGDSRVRQQFYSFCRVNNICFVLNKAPKI